MSDITDHDVRAAIIDQIVAGMFEGKEYAFVAHMNNGYGIGVAVKNERGFHPLVIDKLSFETYDAAADYAEALNEHIGLTEMEAAILITTTMQPSMFN